MALRSALLTAALLLTRAAAAADAACPAQVRVSLPNFEIKPYVLGSDRVESPPGLLIAWTSAALATAAQASGSQCRPHISVKRRPPNRQLAEIERGLLDILPGFSYSANLNDSLVYPMLAGGVDEKRAIIADTVSLYARAGDTGTSWDGVTLRARNPAVGSSTGGAATEETALRYGWRTEVAPTPRADLDKLLAGRIDVIMEPDSVMTPYLTGDIAARVRKLTPPARTSLRYAAVRKGFAEQYPAFTEHFWRALCMQSRASGTALPACR